MIYSMGQIQYEEDLLLDELLTESRKLVIYNDDINTFDHVISCLVEICRHDALQAEQCALLIHYKGKAVVKEGEADKIRVMCEGLCDRGLSAVME
jgi:ATP-dependent Clp protease adaptor protein ClpS